MEQEPIVVSVLKVTEVGDYLRLAQHGKQDFFVANRNILFISKKSLAEIILFLVKNKYLSRKVLEGILSQITE